MTERETRVKNVLEHMRGSVGAVLDKYADDVMNVLADTSSEIVIRRCTHAGWVSGLETAAAEYEKYALDTKALLDHFHEQRDVESYSRYRGKYDDLMSVVKRLRALAAAHEE